MQRAWLLGPFLISVLMVGGLGACGGDDSSSVDAGLPTKTSVIGVEGGEVALANGGKVEIPAGALTEQQSIKVSELDLAELPPLPDNLEAAGKPYAFEPFDLTVAAPVRITLPFSDSAAEVRPIKLDSQDDLDWTTVFPSTIRDMKLEVNTTSFGIYVAARPRRNSGVITLPDGAIVSEDASVPDAMSMDAMSMDATTATDASDDAALSEDASADASNPALTGLTVTPGLLLPAFEVNRSAYLINVGFADVGTALTPTATPGATITIGGMNVTSGAPWMSPPLVVGINTLTLDVSEGGRMSSYALRINRGVKQEAVVRQNVASSGAFAGWSIGVSGDTMVLGAASESSNATGIDGDPTDTSAGSSGAAFVFARTGSTWTQQAYLKPGALGSDSFGTAVAASGDTVVVGSNGEDSNATGINGDENNDLVLTSGAAYVFVRNGTTWTRQAFLKASNTGDGDRFGSALAMSGDTIVVGAPQERSNATGINGNQADNSAIGAGAAYVFVRSGTTWTQEAYLKASNTNLSDQFGTTVSISGDTIVVGAFGEASNATGINGDQTDNSNSQAGAAYVFVRSGTTWTQQAYVKPSLNVIAQQFGESVAVSGDTIVVGARLNTSTATGINGNESEGSLYSTGAAYVFDRIGTTWSQSAYLKASNTSANSAFGSEVAISGDTIAIGAKGEVSAAIGVNGDQVAQGSNPGAIYEFVRTGGAWSQRSYIKSDVSTNQNEFGWSLALDNGTIVVGAPQESTGQTYSGAAWVFR